MRRTDNTMTKITRGKRQKDNQWSTNKYYTENILGK